LTTRARLRGTIQRTPRRPLDFSPDVEKDKSGYSEDNASGDAFTCAGAHGGDVYFEDSGFKGFEKGEGHDSTGDNGADCHAGIEAKVSVGSAENDGKEDANKDGFEGEFRDDGVARDIGFEVVSCGHGGV
jgi:hypothetical protein